MHELTCQDFDIDVVRVGDQAVLRAVSDTLVINLPLEPASLEELIIKAAAIASPLAA